MSDSNLPDIQKRFATLADAASTLNEASDRLSAAIASLDDSLQKLNLGISVWFTYLDRARNDGSDRYDCDQIGYVKINGKWGLGIHRVWGDVGLDDFHESGPWAFNDAPREMRLMAVNKIPGLLHCMAENAINMTQVLGQKAKEVHETATAINEVVTQRGIEAVAGVPRHIGPRIKTVTLNSPGRLGGKS